MRPISFNRVVIILVVLGYVLVNISMQFNFFAGHNIFDKYQLAQNSIEAVHIAQQAYYAKTAFLLILLILLTCRISFFAGHNIFDKYQLAQNSIEAVHIAQQAYYAKTAFLLILLILLTCRISFEAAFAVSFAIYAGLMLIFFGIKTPTILYSTAAIMLWISFFISRQKIFSHYSDD